MKKLYFVNFNGEYEFVCDIAEGDIFISKALVEFQSYYQRYHEDDEGSIWIDYGSHSQFYVLKTDKID